MMEDEFSEDAPGPIKHSQSQSSSRGGEDDRKRSPRKSYIREVCDLPQTKMRSIVNAAYPDLKVDEDAYIALTKAAELLVQLLTKRATEINPNKTHINYDDIARACRSEKRRAFTVLKRSLPYTQEFGEVKKLIKHADEENEVPDD